jgi:hypothetical protein
MADEGDDNASDTSVGARIARASAKARRAIGRMLSVDMDRSGDGVSSAEPEPIVAAEDEDSVAARVGARRQERAQQAATHATNFSNQQQQSESLQLRPEPRAFDGSSGLLSSEEIEETLAAANSKPNEGTSGNGASNGGGDRSCAVSLLSETSTVREFRDGLSAHGLSMMAGVIIKDMGIESAAELES